MAQSAVFNNLPQLLSAAGYDSSIVEAAERVLNTDDHTLIGLRLFLEQFFRASTEMDKAVRFRGDVQSFGSTVDFARSRSWLTEPEKRFVSALYGLLSDSAAHPGVSIVEANFGREAVLYALWLVLSRFQVRAARPFAGYGGSSGRLRLAHQFLRGVRTGALTGPAFQVDFDQDLMQLTRQHLRPADINPLMAVITNDNAPENVRSVCASLVLSPRCYRKPSDDNWPRLVSELDQYCHENLHVLPWSVSCAIAFALANRTNHADRLLDYLELISQTPGALEEHLSDYDKYNGGVANALQYYGSRIQRTDIPLSGCVWEAFYVSRRADSQSAPIRRVLERRLRELEPGRLRTFFQTAVDTWTGAR